MLLIRCPWCGNRPHKEFTYAGDANIRRPENTAAPAKDWAEYVFMRDDPKGPHDELWHHIHGCRRFVKVRRDTATHAIIKTAWPGEDESADAGASGAEDGEGAP